MQSTVPRCSRDGSARSVCLDGSPVTLMATSSQKDNQRNERRSKRRHAIRLCRSDEPQAHVNRKPPSETKSENPRAQESPTSDEDFSKRSRPTIPRRTPHRTRTQAIWSRAAGSIRTKGQQSSANMTRFKRKMSVSAKSKKRRSQLFLAAWDVCDHKIRDREPPRPVEIENRRQQ